MFALLAGAVVLFLLILGMRGFERASITTVKSLLVWIAALGGLSLALLLVLTGRIVPAISALVMFGPMIWGQLRHFQNAPGRTQSAAKPPAMSRQEAYDVLGLSPGASEPAIRDAHRRLMRSAHPDAGGSDWLASRINQARDILLR
jgi:DnaJ homolog subfamily C member 19